MITRRGLLTTFGALAIPGAKHKGKGKPVGWTSQVARQVIIEDSDAGDGLYVYSAPPAKGDLIASITNAPGDDQYDNVIPSGGFVSIFNNSGTPQYATNMEANVVRWFAWNGTAWVQGPALLWTPELGLVIDAAATGSFITIDGPLATPLVAVDPVAGPPTAETWHTVTLDSGWSLNSGYDAPQYRMLPDGNVQFTGLATQSAFTGTVPLNSGAPLDSPYQPAKTHPVCQSSQVGARARVEYRSDGILYAIGTSAYSTTTAELEGAVSLT
jgi:hypothetical protein